MHEFPSPLAPAQVAVFDLDGTITRRDTLVPFLLGWIGQHPARAWRLLPLPVTVLGYALRILDRGGLKAALIRQSMGGAARGEVEAWAQAFSTQAIAERSLAGALAAIRRHREAGDYLVLLSASVDCYVPEIGRQLGFDETICTGLRWRADGRLDGKLTTPNRRGAEKRDVFESLRRRFPKAQFIAYANARSDLAHLVLADAPHIVNANRRTRAAARRLGIPADGWD